MTPRSKWLIEVRSGGEFAEIWINSACVMKLCSDEHEMETIEDIVKAIGTSLRIPFVFDNKFEWDAETDTLIRT